MDKQTVLEYIKSYIKLSKNLQIQIQEAKEDICIYINLEDINDLYWFKVFFDKDSKKVKQVLMHYAIKNKKKWEYIDTFNY